MQNQSEHQWLVLWKHLGAQGNALRVYYDLVARYSEPNRAYHTIQHISDCFYEYQQVRKLAIYPEAIEFALWYHDAIYDTKAKDNEERSARLALDSARAAHLSERLGKAVANHIMATKHTSTPTEPDTQLFVDIDLCILGQSEDKFDQYERQIRKEYEWVPADAFVAGRSAILRSFLERPAIYSTKFFYAKYETHARRNISRSLARL